MPARDERIAQLETAISAQEALRLLEAGSALLEAAHANATWGALLRERDPEAARRHLDMAIRQFETSGLALPADEACRLAAARRSNSLPARLAND